MDPILRLATEKDVPVLLQFIEAYHEFEQVPFDPDNVKTALKPLLTTNSAGYVWLIIIDEETIGYVVLCFGYSIESLGRDGLIDEFFITDKYRGRGIGKKVLEQVIEKARAEGMKALYLEVARDNERAQNLYKSVGFEARDQFFLMDAILSADY